MRYFILVVALLLDPAAVLLLLAATHRPARVTPEREERPGTKLFPTRAASCRR